MKKILLTAACLTFGVTGMFAQKYMTRTGKISFNATVPASPEKIEGVNNEVANIVDAKTGDVIFQVLVKSFKFERALMEEHFNENYMESDKFPKSDFRGKINDVASVNFSKDGTYNVKVSGKLTMHGVTKDVTVPGTVTVKGTSVILKAKFTLNLKEYNVVVPALVADKVAKDAVITLESTLAQK